MKKTRKNIVYSVCLLFLGGMVIYFVYLPNNQKLIVRTLKAPSVNSVTKSQKMISNDLPSQEKIEAKIKRIQTPEVVKGIYLSIYGIGDQILRQKLLNLAEQTEINTMVIDLKTAKGSLGFMPNNPSLREYVDSNNIPWKNVDNILQLLAEHNIYKIARIPVFQDPWFAKKNLAETVKTKTGNNWKDWRGTVWLQVCSQKVWKYNTDLAKEAYARGFDEIQFDYIRYPSDGPIRTIQYTYCDPNNNSKSASLKEFYKYLDLELREEGIPISADLFGLTFWMTDFDLNIGQKLEDAIPYFDYISPMVYPSHYPRGYLGYNNPALYPYEIISKNMEKGKTVYKKINMSFSARPWIQDFDMGAVYTAEMIKKQIQAIYDTQGTGWLLWNARNIYTKDGLEPSDI